MPNEPAGGAMTLSIVTGLMRMLGQVTDEAMRR